MGNRLQKRKKKYLELPKFHNCPNCGKKEAHFVSPCMGEKGFFLCDVQPGWSEKNR